MHVPSGDDVLVVSPTLIRPSPTGFPPSHFSPPAPTLDDSSHHGRPATCRPRSTAPGAPTFAPWASARPGHMRRLSTSRRQSRPVWASDGMDPGPDQRRRPLTALHAAAPLPSTGCEAELPRSSRGLASGLPLSLCGSYLMIKNFSKHSKRLAAPPHRDPASLACPELTISQRG